MNILTRLKFWERVKTRKLFAWEQYGDQMAEMKREGYNLRDIGRRFGISYEGVRLILRDHYNGAKTELLPETKVAKIIGCWQGSLRYLRIKGILNPKKCGNRFFYDQAEIDKAKSIIHKETK